MKKQMGRAFEYMKAGNLVNKWALMNDSEKRYARHLVGDLGWQVNLAIQHAYIFGWQQYTYNYKTNRAVEESIPKTAFWC